MVLPMYHIGMHQIASETPIHKRGRGKLSKITPNRGEVLRVVGLVACGGHVCFRDICAGFAMGPRFSLPFKFSKSPLNHRFSCQFGFICLPLIFCGHLSHSPCSSGCFVSCNFIAGKQTNSLVFSGRTVRVYVGSPIDVAPVIKKCRVRQRTEEYCCRCWINVLCCCLRLASSQRYPKGSDIALNFCSSSRLDRCADAFSPYNNYSTCRRVTHHEEPRQMETPFSLFSMSYASQERIGDVRSLPWTKRSTMDEVACHREIAAYVREHVLKLEEVARRDYYGNDPDVSPYGAAPA